MTLPDLVFDLDGTLWDASFASAEAWTKVLQPSPYQRRITAEEIRGVSGLPFRTCVAELLKTADDQDFQELEHALNDSEKTTLQNADLKAYPDVPATLARLRENGYRLFLVSNCQDWYLKLFFQKTGLDRYFADAICWSKEVSTKLQNLKNLKNNWSLRTPVYIGDTHWDQISSYRAGYRFIFKSTGFGCTSVNCPTIDSVSALPELLTRLESLPAPVSYRLLSETEASKAQTFYTHCGYQPSVSAQDKFVSAFSNEQIIGLVRLTHENETYLLRGMQVHADFQFGGVGTQLLALLCQQIPKGADCYCIPHGWLESFYQQEGFTRVETGPQFLIARYQENRQKFPELILMKRTGRFL